MADNVAITAGAGTSVSTDDAGASGHVQRMKLAVSADGSATHVGADANGLQVQGAAATDAAVAGNPVLVGGRASAAAPTDVSADGDAVSAWRLRNGAAAVAVTAAGALIGGDASNGLDVDVTRLPAPFGAAGATSVAKAEDAASASADVGIPALAVRKATPANTSDTDGDYEMLQISAGRLWTSATIDAALPAGTNAIGKLAANSGVDIGDVDVTSLTGGTIAHDAADSGSPIKVGARAAATLADDTMVANGDRTDAVSDLDGALIVRPGFPLGDLISERVTNTDGASTALTNFGAGGAGVRNFVTAIVVYNSSATAGTIDFRDGTGGAVLFTVPIPATGGCVIANGGMPLFKTSANTALAFDVSAALSTVTISLSGFRSKVV